MSHVTLHIGMQTGTPYGDVPAINVEVETTDDAALVLREIASFIEQAEDVQADSIIDRWARASEQLDEFDPGASADVRPEEVASQLRALAADLEDALLRWPGDETDAAVSADVNRVRMVADELLALADAHAGPEEGGAA